MAPEDPPENPEAGHNAHIAFGPDLQRAVTQERNGRTRSRSHSRSRRRSLSIGPDVSSPSPYGELQIEYRTLSIHASEARRIRDLADSKEQSDGDATLKDADDDYFAALDYHKLSSDGVCQFLNVDSNEGLSHSAAATRLKRDGHNILPKPKTNHAKRIAQYVFGGFCSVLWIGSIIFFICWKPLSNPPDVQNLALAVLIIIVIFLQAGFSAFQDWSTAKTMNSILDLLPSETLVQREGNLQKLPSADLVAGDIVHLRMGAKVPADLRLLSHSGDLRFDRSVLTGESDEIEGAIEATDPNFLESRNIAFMGTTLVNGSGIGVVILTGTKSLMGRIANSTVNVKEEASLIQKEIWRFVRIIVCMTIFLALLILLTWVGWLRVDHPGFLSVPGMLVNVMACVVAFIPEGMPVGVALTLMIVAVRMKRVNILPKGLSTVETLGCVNVICSDKTGTLTQGMMFVNTVAFLDHKFESPDSYHQLQDKGPALEAFDRTSSLCHDAFFEPTQMHLPIHEREIQGSSTDAAVFRFAASTPGYDPKNGSPRAFEIPFNSKNKWMLTLHELPGSNEKKQYRALVKGAPDVLLPACTSYWSYKSNSIKLLDHAAMKTLKDIQDDISRRAERCLLLCEKIIRPVNVHGTNAFSDEISTNSISDLTVVGILGIMDPPRPEIPETVRQCRRAGLRFFMVTGDYALTAAAIARDIGIFTSDREHQIDDVRTHASPPSDEKFHSTPTSTSLLLDGSSIGTLSDEEWDLVCLYEEIVFARTTPEQKLRIVTELRARHYVVAVTGDGVNDAPALRAANVGVAVVSGSDVAIEAADLVLMDEFDSIVDAIRLGRLVFQNLQKVIAYLLPAGSWSEIWPVILNVFFGVPLPLSAFLMIIICVFTDLFLSLSLIMEKEEFDLLSLPPRDHRKDHLINLKIYSQAYLFTGFMETITAHSMFFFYMWKYAGMPINELFFLFAGYDEGYRGYTKAELKQFTNTGQCVYFVTLVFLQWGNILAVRNRRLSIVQSNPITGERRNLWLILSMLISLVIAIFVTEVPGIQRLFSTASIPIEFWFIPIPLGLGLLCMDEIRKVIVRVFPKSFIAKVAW